MLGVLMILAQSQIIRRPLIVPHPRVALSDPNATALDQYVHRVDNSFSYSILNSTAGPLSTIYTLNVTSQTWLTPEDFQTNVGHVWWHYLSVVIPDDVDLSTDALMCVRAWLPLPLTTHRQTRDTTSYDAGSGALTHTQCTCRRKLATQH